MTTKIEGARCKVEEGNRSCSLVCQTITNARRNHPAVYLAKKCSCLNTEIIILLESD